MASRIFQQVFYAHTKATCRGWVRGSQGRSYFLIFWRCSWLSAFLAKAGFLRSSIFNGTAYTTYQNALRHLLKLFILPQIFEAEGVQWLSTTVCRQWVGRRSAWANCLVVFRLFMFQAAALVLVVSWIWLSAGSAAALSAGLGGLIVIIPQALFAVCFFSAAHSRAPRGVLCVFYGGELVKLLIMLGLAYVVFSYFSLLIIPFLIGLLSAMFSPMFGLFLGRNSQG